MGVTEVEKKLADRVALITGATRGIGRGIAEAFLAEGAKVVVTGRSQAKGDQALAEMAAGDSAHFIAGDVREQSSVEDAVTGTIDQFGKIDILVNNAGGSSGFAPVVSLSDEAWNEALNWMLNATFWATRRALQDMTQRQWGRIINISSVEGKQANKATVAHYITNKHAINGLTKAVAFENGELGITCNAICPGAVETDLMRDYGPEAAAAQNMTYDEYVQEYAKDAAINRLNTVEEMATVAVLLASEVGGGITGALWDVNGGTAL
ncbi:MAG: 3-oxoacyl-ACP reductase [Gammaproteobacteria bacterium]|jgi:3-hydroxybutyrate dehydrogenase/3-oxoacyl-[acyl-carrier protein] reductase|nr:3-oxoacyl-ACP reductase [Gammaproteobacteria bacterium]|tara:strand:+ start:292 stop:1089 length:798 start_codon:yes stop_codon:yes gene_type:complete